MNKIFLVLSISVFLMSGSPTATGMTTRGNQILNSKGEPVELKGVNWFGFNNRSTMVDGLWNSSESLTYDFSTVVHRMQLLGFNAVRLPFSFKDLFDAVPRDYSSRGQVPGIRRIQESVTHPLHPVEEGVFIPSLKSPPDRCPGLINDYLPNASTFDRFLWVIDFFVRNGFYILIDNHLREDQTVLEDPKKWIDQWVQLAASITQNPVARDRVMIDLLNEPDQFGIRWESSKSKSGLQDLYLTAMDVLYSMNPDFLFFIEGAGQSGLRANWGDGFATDAKLIAERGLSDPNPFFKTLVQKPYADQVVISPHVYPSSVTYAAHDYKGEGLWERLSSSFGYLTQQGYEGKIFPVAIGEFGSRFESEEDLDSMQDIAKYLQAKDAAEDGRHQPILHWFYWSWNPNSGDTGGIVKDNWLDVEWDKIEYLNQIGLRPWYLSADSLNMTEQGKPMATDIYVQTAPGSFNHQALNLLLENTIHEGSMHFCGTPSNAMQSAYERGGLAFVALKNNIIPGEFVEASLAGLKEFSITRMIAVIRMKIELSLLMLQDDVQNHSSIDYVASHPAALQQISRWKNGHNPFIEIPVPEGTSEAARKLSQGEFSFCTAVLGPGTLVDLYPNLVAIERGIQDREDNYTTFALFEVSKRDQQEDQAHVKDELRQNLSPAEDRFQDSLSFFQIYESERLD